MSTETTLPTSERQVTNQNLETFQTWLKDHGAVFDDLAFGADEDGMNGVLLTKDLSKDQTYASIPFNIMITEPLVREKYPALHKLSSRAVMSLFISNEWQNGSESLWQPYLSVIPNRIMTSMQFDDEDMKYLENTNLQLGTINRREFLRAEYEQILEMVPESERKGFTWDVCLWGYTAISSRAFPYKLIDASASGEMMVPLADSFNHDPSVKVAWSGRGTKTDGMLDLITREPMQAGKQIYTTYGPKANEELLIGYGFCIKDNPYDYVVLKPNFDRDPNAAAKYHILDSCDLLNVTEENPEGKPTFYLTRNHLPADLLAVFRVLIMNETEINAYVQADHRELLDFVGYRNELAMLEILGAMLAQKYQSLTINEYDTSNYLQPWQQSALYYREGQIAVVRHAMSKAYKLRCQLLERMRSNFATGRIAGSSPLLGITNSNDKELLSFNYSQDQEDGQATDTSFLITITEAQRLDPDFGAAIDEALPSEEIEEFGFDSIETCLMLILIRERYKSQSRWRRFLNVVQIEPVEDGDDELLELYEQLLRPVFQKYPKEFDAEHFTFANFQWADLVCRTYSLDIGGDMVIVPM